MTTSDELDKRVAFDAPIKVDDGHSGKVNGWTLPADAVKAWASYRYLRGGETVQAARLEGRQPVVVTIRRSGSTEEISTSWRMRDLRSGVVFNIRSIVPSDDRGFLELTVESGVAV